MEHNPYGLGSYVSPQMVRMDGGPSPAKKRKQWARPIGKINPVVDHPEAMVTTSPGVTCSPLYAGQYHPDMQLTPSNTFYPQRQFQFQMNYSGNFNRSQIQPIRQIGQTQNSFVFTGITINGVSYYQRSFLKFRDGQCDCTCVKSRPNRNRRWLRPVCSSNHLQSAICRRAGILHICKCLRFLCCLTLR